MVHVLLFGHLRRFLPAWPRLVISSTPSMARSEDTSPPPASSPVRSARSVATWPTASAAKSLSVMYLFAAIFLAIVSVGLPQAWMARLRGRHACPRHERRVFQLVPQRFKKKGNRRDDRTGPAWPVSAAFYLVSLGYSRQLTGSCRWVSADLRRARRPGALVGLDRRQDPVAHGASHLTAAKSGMS